MNELLLNLAIQETPALIAGFKTLFAQRHPELPQPTSEEVIAGLESAFKSSLAKDDVWLAAHPEGGL